MVGQCIQLFTLLLFTHVCMLVLREVVIVQH